MNTPNAEPPYLLVPIDVDALVIDGTPDEKGELSEALSRFDNKRQRDVAGDMSWSAARTDYGDVVGSLSSPGPLPFFLNDEPPNERDQGVYLSWELPFALRRSYKVNAFHFPWLPDHWLIVRIHRNATNKVSSKAWFIDSGAVVDQEENSESASVLVEEKNQYVAKRLGIVVPLDNRTNVQLPVHAKRDKFSALGPSATASPTFAANIAENRNMLSWHDKLEDIKDGDLKKGGSLSYLVVGWYSDQSDEPFGMVSECLRRGGLPWDDSGKRIESPSPQQVLDAFKWEVRDHDVKNIDQNFMAKGRCIFHGIVAHIDYWNPETYKGPLLGYPGSPPKHAGGAKMPSPFRVGIGSSMADALVALLAGRESKVKPDFGEELNAWEALEAILYHQKEALLNHEKNPSKKPLERLIHQAGFTSFEAGKIWRIDPVEQPKDGNTPQRLIVDELDAKLVKELNALNAKQEQADAAARDLSALQQELYGRWWQECHDARTFHGANVEDRCKPLIPTIQSLKEKATDLAKTIESDESKLKKQLPKRFALHHDAAPRFWAPADPVVIIESAGGAIDKPSNDKKLACRLGLPGAGRSSMPYLNNFPCADALAALTQEALDTEQFMAKTLDKEMPPIEGENMDDWRTRWAAIKDDVPGIAKYWRQQPWSPIFFDWQITWHPADGAEKQWHQQWDRNDIDFHARAGDESLRSGEASIRRRSLLVPIAGKALTDPIEDLMALTAERMHRYVPSWQTNLQDLKNARLLGQSLTGLQQSFLGRDPANPRAWPNPDCPWRPAGDGNTNNDHDIGELLAPPPALPALPNLPPPLTDDSIIQPKIPFGLTRSGRFTIDHLWIVDRFGQWVNVLEGCSTQDATLPVTNPHLRRRDDESMEMPPRVVQPARLDFRFAAPGNNEVDPVCGWVFYNIPDRALAVCDSAGHLLGELAFDANDNKVSWEALNNGPVAALEKLDPDHRLRKFVDSLIEPQSVAQSRLAQLLGLMDKVLATAPTADNPLIGRPLALVDASLQFELYGSPWSTPAQSESEPPQQPNVSCPVRLGDLQDPADGLIGYFADGKFEQIVAPAGYDPSALHAGGEEHPDYVVPAAKSISVAFDKPTHITLLMDPHAAVMAAPGMLPAKSVRLDVDDIASRIDGLEYAFRVGPILIRDDMLSCIPVPGGLPGEWHFLESQPSAQPRPVMPFESRPRFGTAPQVLVEGRLVLRKAPPKPSNKQQVQPANGGTKA